MEKTHTDKIQWIEALRTFAMLMVVVPHFIATFCPEVFSIWQSYSLFMKGISGKHGVAIFCVLLGFFSSKRSSKTFPTYFVQRYLQFAINIGIVLVPFVLAKSLLLGDRFGTFMKGIMLSGFESVVLGASLNPTLWCVRDMFFGSLVCFVLGQYCKMNNKWKEFALIALLGLFMYFINVWIAVCVFGAGLRVFLEIKLAHRSKSLLCVLFVVLIPLLYRRSESQLTYALQGISCCLFMYVCMYVCSKHMCERSVRISL